MLRVMLAFNICKVVTPLYCTLLQFIKNFFFLNNNLQGSGIGLAWS